MLDYYVGSLQMRGKKLSLQIGQRFYFSSVVVGLIRDLPEFSHWYVTGGRVATHVRHLHTCI